MSKRRLDETSSEASSEASSSSKRKRLDETSAKATEVPSFYELTLYKEQKMELFDISPTYEKLENTISEFINVSTLPQIIIEYSIDYPFEYSTNDLPHLMKYHKDLLKHNLIYNGYRPSIQYPFTLHPSPTNNEHFLPQLTQLDTIRVSRWLKEVLLIQSSDQSTYNTVPYLSQKINSLQAYDADQKEIDLAEQIIYYFILSKIEDREMFLLMDYLASTRWWYSSSKCLRSLEGTMYYNIPIHIVDILARYPILLQIFKNF
jgi:hypothetical protein